MNWISDSSMVNHPVYYASWFLIFVAFTIKVLYSVVIEPMLKKDTWWVPGWPAQRGFDEPEVLKLLQGLQMPIGCFVQVLYIFPSPAQLSNASIDVFFINLIIGAYVRFILHA